MEWKAHECPVPLQRLFFPQLLTFLKLFGIADEDTNKSVNCPGCFKIDVYTGSPDGMSKKTCFLGTT